MNQLLSLLISALAYWLGALQANPLLRLGLGLLLSWYALQVVWVLCGLSTELQSHSKGGD